MTEPDKTETELPLPEGVEQAPICAICGELGSAQIGDLGKYKDRDGLYHFACLVGETANAANAKAKRLEEQLAEKEAAQPTTPCEKSRLAFEKAAISYEAHEEQEKKLLETMQGAQAGFDECRRKEGERAQKLADSIERKLNPQKPLVEYVSSGSSLKVAAPTIAGGSVLTTLLLIFVLGFFDSKPVLDPVEVVKTVEVKVPVEVPAEFPEVVFTFDRTSTKSYKALEGLIRNSSGQFYHPQLIEMTEALTADKVKLVFRVKEDGNLELLRSERMP